MSNLITGLFDSEVAAEKAVSELKQIGYTQNEISIIMKDRNTAADFADEVGASRTMEGIGTGAAIGGTLGAVLGGILAVGSIIIPGVGPIVAAGSLVSMLAGAGAGGLAGSLLGWLTSAGIPDDVAPYYERSIGEGGIVVAVATHPGDETRVQQILRGESIAFTGYNNGMTEGYVSNSYATRYDDIQRPARLYDSTTMINPTATQNYDSTNNVAYNTAATTTGEAQRTANSASAEARSDQRTAEARERAAHRESHDDTMIDDVATSVRNAYDNTVTAAENQTDKVATGLSNTADRVTNP